MPWCESCHSYLMPNRVPEDHACPKCGGDLDSGKVSASAEQQAPEGKVPWHFWLLLGAVSVYLGWRFLQLIIWVL